MAMSPTDRTVAMTQPPQVIQLLYKGYGPSIARIYNRPYLLQRIVAGEQRHAEFVQGYSPRLGIKRQSGCPQIPDILDARFFRCDMPCVDGSGLARTFFTPA